jgi:hypothetical protein
MALCKRAGKVVTGNERKLRSVMALFVAVLRRQDGRVAVCRGKRENFFTSREFAHQA